MIFRRRCRHEREYLVRATPDHRTLDVRCEDCGHERTIYLDGAAW